MTSLARSDSRLPYYRIAGYIVTIVMHLANAFVLLRSFRGDVMKDPNILFFQSFLYKFITVWTFTAQTCHAAIGLSCDLLTLTIGDHKFLRHIKQTRETMFASIVVPFTFMIPTCFWPIFLYDRELILPYYTTKIVNNLSNHIMHSAVVPATLWEMAFQPRQAPTSHKLNLTLMSAFATSYLAIMFNTFYETGAFPYPIMTMLYGSIYFVIFFILVLLTLPMYYYGQWSINRLLWRESVKNK